MRASWPWLSDCNFRRVCETLRPGCSLLPPPLLFFPPTQSLCLGEGCHMCGLRQHSSFKDDAGASFLTAGTVCCLFPQCCGLEFMPTMTSIQGLSVAVTGACPWLQLTPAGHTGHPAFPRGREESFSMKQGSRRFSPVLINTGEISRMKTSNTRDIQ